MSSEFVDESLLPREDDTYKNKEELIEEREEKTRRINKRNMTNVDVD